MKWKEEEDSKRRHLGPCDKFKDLHVEEDAQDEEAAAERVKVGIAMATATSIMLSVFKLALQHVTRSPQEC